MSYCLSGKEAEIIFVGTDPKITYLRPAENEIVFYKNILLEWKPDLCAENYRLQLSNTKKFDQLLLDTLLFDNQITLNVLLKDMEFYWRVRCNGEYFHDKEFGEETFFKTSNIILSNPLDAKDIQIIPTNIGGNEVLYIDNPDLLHYEIVIYDCRRNTRFKRFFRAEKFGINTKEWPRGLYEVEIHVSPEMQWTKQISLN